jgi:hypothetical protein
VLTVFWAPESRCDSWGERARKGEPVATLLEDYPGLDAEDVEFARMFVALGRPPGRPRKKVKFVRGDG